MIDITDDDHMHMMIDITDDINIASFYAQYIIFSSYMMMLYLKTKYMHNISCFIFYILYFENQVYAQYIIFSSRWVCAEAVTVYPGKLYPVRLSAQCWTRLESKRNIGAFWKIIIK